MAIYSQPARSRRRRQSPVRMVVSGGMPSRHLGAPSSSASDLSIFEFYGAMDGGGMAFKPVGEGPIGSFGKPMAHRRDEDPRPAGFGSARRAWSARSAPEPTDGEAGRPSSTTATPRPPRRRFRRGWNRSGDMGHRDADDWLFFDYRAGGGIRHNGDFVKSRLRGEGGRRAFRRQRRLRVRRAGGVGRARREGRGGGGGAAPG